MKTYFFNTVLDITVEALNKLKIKCIFLDIDNTIKPVGSAVIDGKYIGWINSVKSAGINIILCSNNFKENVSPTAAMTGCDFASFCLKPSPFGFFRAYIKSHARHSEILVIGDQFFTDILGAKLCFLKSFLVEPISKEYEAPTVKLRRKLTSAFTNKIKGRDNPYKRE